MAKNPTPQTWAAALLQRLGIPQSAGALQAVVGWERAEGGHWNNTAHYNPLNTTQPEPGAGNTGTQGNIKVYRDWGQGLDATVQTLKNGRYGGILNALKAGNPNAVASAIGASPWGTNGGLVSRVINSTPAVHGVHPANIGSSSRTGTGGSGKTPGASLPAPGAQPDLGGAGSDFTGLLSSLLTKPQPQPIAMTPLAAPSFAAAPPMPKGFQGLLPSEAPQTPARTGVSDALGLVGALGSVSPSVGSSERSQGADAADVAASASPLVADASTRTGEKGGASTALNWAESKIGFKETGTNSGGLASYLNKQFGFQNAPWCAMFTSAAVTKGGAPASARTASVAEVRRQAQQGGGGYQKGFVNPGQAQPGDLILFGDAHIGMVQRVSHGRVYYVGGNQSNGVTQASVPVGGGDIVRPKYGAR